MGPTYFALSTLLHWLPAGSVHKTGTFPKFFLSKWIDYDWLMLLGDLHKFFMKSPWTHIESHEFPTISSWFPCEVPISHPSNVPSRFWSAEHLPWVGAKSFSAVPSLRRRCQAQLGLFLGVNLGVCHQFFRAQPISVIKALQWLPWQRVLFVNFPTWLFVKLGWLGWSFAALPALQCSHLFPS
jgi:hypothetical protein